MNPFASLNGAAKPRIWSIGGLDPSPEEEWPRMRAFLSLSDAEIAAMLTTVEPLFKRGHELVVGTYDYLLQNPETAAILGWEGGADPRICPSAAASLRCGWRGCWAWTSAPIWRTTSSAPASSMRRMDRGAPMCRRSTSRARSAWSTPLLPAFSPRKCPRTLSFQQHWRAGTRCLPCTCT